MNAKKKFIETRMVDLQKKHDEKMNELIKEYEACMVEEANALKAEQEKRKKEIIDAIMTAENLCKEYIKDYKELELIMPADFTPCIWF